MCGLEPVPPSCPVLFYPEGTKAFADFLKIRIEDLDQYAISKLVQKLVIGNKS